MHPLVSALIDRQPPRAAPLIVTAFGDAIVPLRAQVWMADLIALCGLVGISDTLVRTAVSRLVAGGRLQGVKDGRRSAYGLTPAARDEFDAAERLIYGPVPPFDWVLVPLADDARAAPLEARGFARLRGGMLLGPGPVGDGVLSFALTPMGCVSDLPALAEQAWPLGDWAQAYRAFAEAFGVLTPVAAELDAESAIAARLLLVDAWRAVRLRDVGLPPDALPPGWPRAKAQAVFLDLYARLLPASDRWLARGIAGPGAARAPTTTRAELLAQSHAGLA